MKNIKSVLGAMVVVSVSIVVAFAGNVSAATNKGNGMEISPVRTDLVIKPGESKTITVYVRNVTEGTEVLNVVKNDFEAKDETGTPSLMLNGEANPTHGLKRYMTAPERLTIPKGKQQGVQVTIKIPKDAAGGGYYGAVRFAPGANSSNAVSPNADNVALAGSVASLILVRVPGDITEELQIASLAAVQGEKAKTFFTSGKNVDAMIRFRNSGNIQVQPYGKVTLKKGSKVLGTYEINDATPPGNVIPDSIRRFTVDLDGKVGSFGKYQLVGNFGYGENGQLLSATTTFFVIPLYMIIGVVVLILLIIGMILFLKGYKKRVLRGARR